MLVHAVYFWLRADLSDAQRADFRAGLHELKRIQTVLQIHVGTPADSVCRSHVDDSFSFGLLTVFNDVAGRESYQSDPIHLAFLEKFRGYATRTQIYDSDDGVA